MCFSQKGELVYVGMTMQPMATRLRQGMTADGKNGYHGYAWGKADGTYRLDIWQGMDHSKKQLEAVEAECVYLYRERTSRWPKYQTEIHFNNSYRYSRTIAGQILDSLQAPSDA